MAMQTQASLLLSYAHRPCCRSPPQLSLCGQSLEVIMQTAYTALNFLNKQQALHAKLSESKASNRLSSMQAQCEEKLQQVHGAYMKQKQKVEVMRSHLQEALAEKEELSSKCQQRAK